MAESHSPEKIAAAKEIKIKIYNTLLGIRKLDFPFLDTNREYTWDDEDELMKLAGQHLKAHTDLIFEELLPKLIDILGFRDGTFQFFDLLSDEEYQIHPVICQFFESKLLELIEKHERSQKGPKTD